MKKTITILGLVALAFQMNAQSSLALNEDFEDQIIDPSISSTNPNGLVSTETGNAMSLQYNSMDLPYVSLNYSPVKSVMEADSVTITYDVDMVSIGGGFDGGGFEGSNSVYYTDMVSRPFSFGGNIIQYTLFMTGQDFDVSNVVFEGGKAFVTKGYSSPISSPISLISFDFQKSYQLGTYFANSPEELAATACNAEFTNPNEVSICMVQVISNAPTIQSSLLVDNITVTSHTVTGIEGGLENESIVVKAFNLSGKEVSAETNNEPIIVIYSDGKTERVYNLR